MLIKQPTNWPTRKIAAVIVAGMVTGGLQSAAQVFSPDANVVEFLAQVDIWVQMGVMSLAGYLTKEQAA